MMATKNLFHFTRSHSLALLFLASKSYRTSFRSDFKLLYITLCDSPHLTQAFALSRIDVTFCYFCGSRLRFLCSCKLKCRVS